MIKKNNIEIESENTGSSWVSYIHLQNTDTYPPQATQQMVIDGNTVRGGQDFKGDIVVDIDQAGKIIGIEIRGDVIPERLLK